MVGDTDQNGKSEGDILRAGDILPPYRKKTPKQPAPQKPGQGGEKSEIPRFDLSEDIMAAQRKIIAIRRKAPGSKTQSQYQPIRASIIGHTIERPMSVTPQQEKIIADIVTRDIERLCGSGAVGL